MDRIACRTARESGIYRRTSDLLSKTWGNVTELTHGSITSMIKKRYHMIMEINRRVKEWSEHDKQNQRYIEKP